MANFNFDEKDIEILEFIEKELPGLCPDNEVIRNTWLFIHDILDSIRHGKSEMEFKAERDNIHNKIEIYKKSEWL